MKIHLVSTLLMLLGHKVEDRTFMRYLFIMLSLLALTGCTSRSLSQFQPTTQVVDKPVLVQPPDLAIKYQLNFANNPALKKAYQQYLRTGKAPNIITEGFEQFAYGTGIQPVIAASTFELTVISLEVGENIANVSSGDPLRWSYSIAYSGVNQARQAHVMVKPTQENISTDLVITTDQRLYTLKLVSTVDGKYARNISFWYPQEMQAYWRDYNAKQKQKITQETTVANLSNLNINQLNFAYRLSHSGWRAPVWMPVRVFDDGVHTYIQFSPIISSRDIPALFIQKGNEQELVNYRFKPPYFIVDKIFERAVLIMGTGSRQARVTINTK
jgi:type IV secretion system protein TrbG